MLVYKSIICVFLYKHPGAGKASQRYANNTTSHAVLRQSASMYSMSWDLPFLLHRWYGMQRRLVGWRVFTSG